MALNEARWQALHAVRRSLRHAAQRETTRAWNTWIDAWSTERHQLATVQAAVQRMMAESLSRAWNAWAEVWEAEAQQRLAAQIAKLAARHRIRHGRGRGFRMWAAAWLRDQRVQMGARRAVLRGRERAWSRWVWVGHGFRLTELATRRAPQQLQRRAWSIWMGMWLRRQRVQMGAQRAGRVQLARAWSRVLAASRLQKEGLACLRRALRWRQVALLRRWVDTWEAQRCEALRRHPRGGSLPWAKVGLLKRAQRKGGALLEHAVLLPGSTRTRLHSGVLKARPEGRSVGAWPQRLVELHTDALEWYKNKGSLKERGLPLGRVMLTSQMACTKGAKGKLTQFVLSSAALDPLTAPEEAAAVDGMVFEAATVADRLAWQVRGRCGLGCGQWQVATHTRARSSARRVMR